MDKYKGKHLIDQHRSYIAYILLDKVLKNTGEFEKSYLTTNEYGRPHLTDYYFKRKHIEFNISHSGHWIVLAISDQKIGIDIEEILPIDLVNLIPFIFENNNIQIFLENIQDSKGQLRAFYSKWVQKESYLKMIGTGLYGLRKERMIIWRDDKQTFYKEYVIEEEYKMGISSFSEDLPNHIIFMDYFEVIK